MSDDNMPPEAPEPVPFDASTLSASDVPYIGPMPDEAPEPDHNASASMEDEPAPVTPRDRRRGFGKRDKSASKPAREVPKVRAGSLVKPLTEMYTSVGLMIAPFDPACSIVFVENAKKCAESMDALARENDAVRRALLALTQTSAWGGVLMAHLPILLVITAHHGPRDIAERTAPLAAMFAPNAASAAAAAGGDSAA